MHRSLFLFLPLTTGLGISLTQAQNTLIINELMAINVSGLLNEQGLYSDWFELYNYGDDSVSLNALYVSDDPFNPFLYQVPEGTPLTLAPGEYFVFFADGNANAGHVPFELNHEGEFLGIYTSEGVAIHEVSFGTQAANISYGLLPGTLEWNFFTEASPGSPNNGPPLLGILEQPTSSSSFTMINPEDSLLVTLWHNDPLVEIRYTLTSQEVGPLSPLYTEAQWLHAPTILRARAYRTGYAESRELYVHVLPSDTTGSAYTISIVADPENLFGPEGIYTNFLSGLEKPSNMAVFNSGGTVILESGCGLKIHAPEFRDQQAFRLSARSEYGSAQFNASIFPNRPYQEFQHILLRSGGNDGLELGKSALRDPLISGLFAELNPAYGNSAYRPATVFLNGSFWGLYELRERQDEHWLRNFYGAESGFTLLERTLDEPGTYHSFAGTWDEYNEMVTQATTLDMSDSLSFAAVSEQIDLLNFCDYQLTEIFVCNRDWLSNNVKFWKPGGTGGQWQWIVWDTDWGFGTFQPFSDHGFPDWNALHFAMSDNGGWLEGVIETELLQHLVLNQEFRWLFCSRAADLCNSFLSPPRILSQLDSLAEEISAYIPRQCERWGGNAAAWQNELSIIEEFVIERPFHFLNDFSAMFNLGERHDLSLQTEPSNSGYIGVNTIYTQGEQWTGSYFENLPVRLSAYANPGYVFSQWSDGITEAYRELVIDENINLSAIYVPAWAGNDPVINEIMPCHSNDCPGGAWIELANPSNSTINLNGWRLGLSGEPETVLGENCSIGPASFAIIAENPQAFTQQYGIPALPCPLGFSLADSAAVYVISNGGELADAVLVGNEAQGWPERSEGKSFELQLHSEDNSQGQNWFVRNEPGGSPGEANLYKPPLTGIAEALTSAYPAFPNPFTNKITIPFREEISAVEVFTYDGRKLEGIHREIEGKTLVLSRWENTPPGIYTCRLITRGGNANIRLVKRD